MEFEPPAAALCLELNKKIEDLLEDAEDECWVLDEGDAVIVLLLLGVLLLVLLWVLLELLILLCRLLEFKNILEVELLPLFLGVALLVSLS